MFPHPAVRDIIEKRLAYDAAKQGFLHSLLSNPEIYTTSQETLNFFLELTVQDTTLMGEIRAYVEAGFPVIHWGEEPACEAEHVPSWQRVQSYSDAVTCVACQRAHEEANEPSHC